MALKSSFRVKKRGLYKAPSQFLEKNALDLLAFIAFTKTNLILERLKLLENFEEIIIITNIPGRFEQYYGNQNEKARKEIQKYLDLL